MIPIIIALISILILAAINCILIWQKPSNKLEWVLLIVYISNFLFEICMLVFAMNGRGNHFLVNIHTLTFGLGMFLILCIIWKRLLYKEFPKPIFIIISILYIAVWIFDNTILHSIEIFNPPSQAIIFFINLCIVIYLMNVMLFAKKINRNANIDKYLIFAFLMHCFGCVVIESFFNYHVELPENLYILLSDIGQVLSILTHSLVFIAMLWLVKARKYT